MDATLLGQLINNALPGQATGYSGYPATAAKLPYAVYRPVTVMPGTQAICGLAITWHTQWGIYCCAGSIEASYNLALILQAALHGARAAGSTLSVSLTYSGALVEGHYETMLTVQTDQGNL